MAFSLRVCEVCGEEVRAVNMGQHMRREHPEEYSQDEAPRPKKAAAKKQSAPRRAAAPKAPSVLPLSVQLQLPYNLLANATARRMPHTSATLSQQAAPCAAAWDQFLMRYPALREKIEQGMIAGDVVALIMSHLVILQVFREEIAAQQRAASGYDGGIAQQPAAAA